MNSQQDDIKKYDDLGKREKVNVEVDLLAKKTLLSYVTKGCPAIKTDIQKGDKWALLVDEEQVTSKIKKTIYNHIWAANGKEYWIKKLGIHPIYAHLVDWEVVRKASKLCNDQKRKRRIKHMANIGPVGKVMFQRKE